MTADHEGLDLLKQAIAEVEASLPTSTPRRGWGPKLAWAAAAVAVFVAIAVGGRVVVKKARIAPTPVEILALRIDGADARVELIDSSRAGSIVVVARPDGAAGEDGGGERR